MAQKKETTVKKPRVMSLEKFNTLSKAEQRILIAKDVIAQIKANKYKPAPGIYVTLKIPKSLDITKDAKSNLENVENCVVCGVGACLVSTVKFKNTLTLHDLDHPTSSYKDSTKAAKLLKSVFPPSQLALIETAFEREYCEGSHWSSEPVDGGGIGGKLTDKQAYKAENFGDNYWDSSTKRLLAIMENIITNAGTFKP